MGEDKPQSPPGETAVLIPHAVRINTKGGVLKGAYQQAGKGIPCEANYVFLRRN